MKSKKYVTVTNSNGLGLYDVAKVMTNNGHKMNHSTVRNIINRSFFKLAKNISDSYNFWFCILAKIFLGRFIIKKTFY